MGLDQYAYIISKESVDFTDTNLIIQNEKFLEEELKAQICYWRKHPSLQGWMENLYTDRGGKGEFNAVAIALFEEDLDLLEKDIINNKLPFTQGFFFGQDPDINSSDPEEQEYFNTLKLKDLEFVKKAKEHVKKGKIVFYDSWW